MKIKLDFREIKYSIDDVCIIIIFKFFSSIIYLIYLVKCNIFLNILNFIKLILQNNKKNSSLSSYITMNCFS
jgi:hypothetical protein